MCLLGMIGRLSPPFTEADFQRCHRVVKPTAVQFSIVGHCGSLAHTSTLICADGFSMHRHSLVEHIGALMFWVCIKSQANPRSITAR